MKTRSRTEYSLINMLAGVAGYGINTIVGFVCRVIFVRTLSVDYLGVSGLFSNILSMLSLAELGIASAVVYALYKPLAENNEKKIASIMQFYRKAYAVIGVVVAAAGLVIAPFLEFIITEPPAIKENIYHLYLLYLLSTVVGYFFSYRQSLLIAAQRQYIVSGYNYAVTIAQSIIQIVWLLKTHEYIGYLIIQIAGGIFYNIWISRKATKDYPYIADKNAEPLLPEEKKSLFVNIKALAINKVSGVMVNSTDNIAITFFTGLHSVGFASNYTILVKMLDSFVTPLFNGLTGSVGNYNASSDKESKYKLFKILNLSNFWIYGWGAIGIAFVSEDLVWLLYGQQYVLPSKIPMILAINMFSIGMLHASYTYKNTLGLFRYGQYLLFFTGIINLVLDVVLGKIYGMFGIYLATLIARLCTNIWYEPYAVFRYGLEKNPIIYLYQYVKYIAVLIVTGAVCGVLCSKCDFSIAQNVVCKVLICTIVPNAVFVAIFGRTEEFCYIINRVKLIVEKIISKRKKDKI